MAVFEQSQWGAGMYRGRKAPEGSVYDALNALVNDEGDLFKRGVTALRSASDAGATNLERLAAVYMRAPAANRIIASHPTAMYALDGSNNPVLVTAIGNERLGRPAGIGDLAVFALGNISLLYYGGSLKAANYTTGTATFTNGSATLTGAGTSWLANVDAGMIVDRGTGVYAVVKSVQTNTSLTLTAPWSGPTAAGSAYTAATAVTVTHSNLTAFGARSYVAAASGVLLLATGNRVYFAEPDAPWSFPTDNFHELPASVNVVGLESRGTSAMVFTTEGVWDIGNLYLSPVDDFGNIQRPVERVNQDLVLWDDLGVAAWDSGVVVPAIDDVYLISPDYGVRALSESIRPLLRSYAKSGYQAGMAAVHRGHYVLPVTNGSTWVDTLVCRLDRPFEAPNGRVMFPWTRWAGHAGGLAYAALVEESARSPKLLGISGLRVTDLTGCMDAASASGQDANSTTPVFRVDENDVDTGPGLRPNTVEKVRYVYETTGGTPTIDVSYATGPEGSSYTAATLKRGGGASTGTDYSAWKVVEKAERVRFRFECSSQVTSLILRRREAHVRTAAQG